jgi:HEAT repeat protein
MARMTFVCAALAAMCTLAAPAANDAASAVTTIASGSRPEVERAIDRIQYLGTPRAVVKSLVRMAQGEIEGSPENALYALSVLHPPEAAPVFLSHLSSDDGPTRLLSCQGLARLASPRGGGRLVAARLSDPVPAVRAACARALGGWKGAGQGGALARALAHESDSDARAAEIDALGHAAGRASVKALEARLSDADEAEKLAVAHGLALLGAKSGEKILLGYATSTYSDARSTAVKLLADVRAKWAGDALAALARDDDPSIALHAGRALAERKDPRAIPLLVLRAERAKGADREGFETALAELKVSQAQRLDIIAKAGGAK